MSRPPNELEIDNQWQLDVFNRLLGPLLQAHAHQRAIVYIPFGSPVANMLQLRAHVDALAQLPGGGMLSLEFKIVRWPGVKEGRPSHTHWSDFFLETWSCSVEPNKTRGWMYTCEADVMLWCQCGVREERLDCFPLPFARLKTWFAKKDRDLRERKVPNVINGRALWSVGKLAPISTVTRELKVEGFRVTAEGLVSDLYGEPILGFLQGRPGV